MPNDSARRKALDRLPPTLALTYERILLRVNKEDETVQKLVERVLRWVICAKSTISPAAIAEIVSIEAGDTRIWEEAIPTEQDIMHWCSSLIRKDPEGNIELSHYSVRKFLVDIPDDPTTTPFTRYRVDIKQDNVMSAVDCLRYLSMEDFATGCTYDADVYSERHKKHSFFKYAVKNWDYHAVYDPWDRDLLDLMCNFFQPQRNMQFLAWIQERVFRDWWPLGLEFKYGCLAEDFTYIAEILIDVSTLHIAASLALPGLVSWLLEQGSNANQRSNSLGTPLSCATMGVVAFQRLREDDYSRLKVTEEELWRSEFRLATLEVLISGGADPNLQGRGCLTPLDYIIDFAPKIDEINLKMIQILCEAGEICTKEIVEGALYRAFAEDDAAKLFSKAKLLPEDKPEILEMIASSVDHETMRRLFDDVNDDHKPSSDLSDQIYGRKMREAARWDQVEVLQQYYDKNRSIDLTDDKLHRTALHFAASNGQIEAVQFLIRHYASPKASDVDENTPLHLACIGDHEETIKYLWEYSESTNFRGESPLMLAAANCSASTFSSLLTQSSQEAMSGKASNGDSLLHFAACAAKVGNVTYLVNKGLDVNVVSNDMCTPIMALVKDSDYYNSSNPDTSCESVLKVLIDHGADLGRRDCNGDGILHLLFQPEVDETLRVCLEWINIVTMQSKIQLDCKNKAGQTPIMLMARFDKYWPEQDFEEVLEALKHFLDKGASLDLQDEQGQTCLHILCKHASGDEGERAVKMLLDHGASCELKNADLKTALDEALEVKCDVDNAGIIDLVISKHPDLHQQNDKGKTILHRIFGVRRPLSFVRVAKSVVERKGDLSIRDRQGMTVLISAFMGNQETAITEILLSGVPDKDLQRHDYKGRGLLNQSMSASLHEDIISTILERTKEINSRDITIGGTALHWASATIPSPKIMRIILSLCDNFSIKDYRDREPLFIAAASGNDWMVSELIAAKVGLEHRASWQNSNGDNYEGLTPLLATVCDIEQPPHQKCAELLIQAGADIEARDYNDWGLVAYCADRGDESMLHYLSTTNINFASTFPVMSSGGNVDGTALHLAAELGHAECVRILLSTGAFPNIDVAHQDGLTPLLLAAQNCEVDVCRILCSNGANVNIVDPTNGKSPLHEAAEVGSISLTLLLLNYGADISLRNKAGLTAEFEALARGHSDVVKILQSNSSNGTQEVDGTL